MTIPFPNKKYQIIYADPPWEFSSRQGQDGGRPFIPLDKHYPLMSNNSIAKLEVNNIAENDCLLFLWCVSSHLDIGIDIIKKWGFRYVTVAFVWLKHYQNGTICVNRGYWTMPSCELCLLGIKGHPKRKQKNVRQLVEAIRTNHSKKPSEVRDRIVQLVGDLPRIELFARPPKDRLFEDESYEGWDVWGNEV